MAEAEEYLEFDVYTPAIEVTHNRSKYTCNDEGLAKSGARFCADLSEYLPVLFKNGTINKSKSMSKQSKSPDWWRAQCSFRGLPTSGGVNEVQARLRSGPNTMIKELVDLETKLKAKWKVKAGQDQRLAEQKFQDQQRQDEKKGVERLNAIFKNNNETRASVFKKDCEGLGSAAKKLNLQFRWIRAPFFSFNAEWDDQWIIVGRTSVDVETKDAQLKQEKEDQKLAEAMQKEEKENAARDAEARLHSSIATASSTQDGEWDVTGVWKITCPEFEHYQFMSHDKMNLRLYQVTGTKVSQLFAKFDFETVKGWLRFEDPATPAVPAASIGSKRKRRAWDSFLIPLDTKPSPQHSTWNFRWRGKGNGGDGYVEHGSDEYQCSMTFSGKGGCTLSGIFNSDFLNCEFKGVKLGLVTPKETASISIDEQWGYLYDSNYSGSPT